MATVRLTNYNGGGVVEVELDEVVCKTELAADGSGEHAYGTRTRLNLRQGPIVLVLESVDEINGLAAE